MIAFLYRPIFLQSLMRTFFHRRLSQIQENDKSKFVNPFKKATFVNDTLDDSKIANRICLTVLGNGAIGQPRCVGLFTDFKSYLFNCGEGVGRLCREYDVNIVSIRHIFLTQREWRNMSGVHDIYLNHMTYGVPKMTLHGPPGIEHFLHILPMNYVNISLSVKCPLHHSYEDETLRIECIPIESTNNYHAQERKNYVSNKGGDISLSYVCKIFDKPGDLNLEKCVEHGVPVGPDLLKLKNGEDVTLSSGRIIRSADVCNAPSSGSVFLVVDCPDESFLDELVTEKKFDEYLLPSDASLDVSVVFHFTPSRIIRLKKYQDWINRFHQKTIHFILNSDNPTISSSAVHQMQHILHFLHPKIFPPLQEKKEASASYLGSSSTIIQAPPMLQFHLRPDKEICWDNVANLDFKEYIESIKDLPGFTDSVKDLESALKHTHQRNSSLKQYPEVVFLGTGSATSTAYRNVSAILLNANAKRSILLDCGEGAYTQLVRYYGCSDVHTVLKKISCIFISHKHTDHYMGLFQLIKARIEAFEVSGDAYHPLVLIVPHRIKTVIKCFTDIFGSFLHAVRLFSCAYLHFEKERGKTLKNILGGIEIQTVPVVHCSDAHGAIIQMGSDWKIVYSGDTAPCQKLIDAGKNCTLLIHEASIEDDLINEANSKNHSTPAQVVDVADKMNAQHTIMTHFSKRYLAAPIFQEYSHQHVGFSFDFMKVQLCDLPVVPLFLPALKCLFKEQLESHFERSSSVVSFENVFMKNVKS